MKLNKMIASVAIAACATSAFADSTRVEDLTSGFGILVKNNYDQCVTVLKNEGRTGCGEAAPEPPKEMKQERQVITLSADTYFDFDKAVLKPEGKQAIQQLAQDLNSRGANVQKITVVGNTDSKGSDAYNQKLSERRAAAVGNYMIENGVPASLIEAYGNGERNPVADNATAEGRAQNRRVDIAVDGVVEVPVSK
ncbi:MAG: OmpA family protein [Cardiobacteriaceae bacterium]|nr:OmpA family protein [Cardiobacteriaceae bacterium]